MEQLSDNSHLESIPPATKRSPSLLRTTTMALMAMALSACDKYKDPRAADFDKRMLSASGARPVYNGSKHVLDGRGKVTWEFPQRNSDGSIKKDSGGNVVYGPTPPQTEVSKEEPQSTPVPEAKQQTNIKHFGQSGY